MVRISKVHPVSLCWDCEVASWALVTAFLSNSCTGAGMVCTSVGLIRHVLPTDEVSTALQTSILSAAESVAQFVLRRLTMNELQSVRSFGLRELSLAGCYCSGFPSSTLSGHFCSVRVFQRPLWEVSVPPLLALWN